MTTVGRLYDIALKTRALASPIILSVRYRKPRWLPIAKSKEFYVREPTPIDPVEYWELKHRYSHYRSSVKSIRQYLRKELVQKTKDDLHEGEESTEFALMEQQTQDWNQSMALLREERQMEESVAKQEYFQQLMSQREERKLEEAIEANKRIHDLKVISKDLITEENLEEEVEKMLDSRSDYNYALTRDGKILKGENPNFGNEKQTSS